MIALFGSAVAQEDGSVPPVITIDNAAMLVPVYEFAFDSAMVSWVTGAALTSDATPTPTPSNRPSLPRVHINSEGTRAVIITQQPNALWLVDLRAGTWRPFLISTLPSAYIYPIVIVSPNFIWVSIQAIWEAQGDAFVRFWRLEDLFALGGAPISATH